jgi:acylphosphatase
LLAEGSAAGVDRLVKWLQSTQAPGHVEKVAFELSDGTGEFDDFRIVG